ncbi:amidohydrolase family protein [Corynebacterium poyangense]|uniref:Amidohydrolase family protein n=1 Tax=Corynebacterium poyangense TaxID=2684405 RepID=A0A7H0SQ54_9CORY|nr:amidohydrolase [Corynebacterium poyangense]MBZ8178384.1 amidohydrolase family protein [Corynebacterium poyangense]QNQ90679.1 amidohydrolase family protein [Corynebacterium poyangense]
MALDTLFVNGNIYTLDPSRPKAHAIGVHQGRIISLDDELPPSVFSEVKDLAGATVLPGFQDAHCHLTHIGQESMQVDIRPSAAPDKSALFNAIAQACQNAKPGEWVIGSGYNQNYLDGHHPTAVELDEVSFGHPVYLIHNSRHMGVANTKAFELSGFPERRGVPIPEGGDVPCENGQAVGLLLETARALIMDHIPPTTPETVATMVEEGSRALAALGVTTATDPGIGAPDHIGMCPQDLTGYQIARDSGRMSMRAIVMPYLTTLHPLAGLEYQGHPLYTLDLGLRTGLGDSWLRIGPTKVLSDGSLIGRSAAMREPYAHSDSTGLMQFSEEFLRERIIGAHLAGWDIAVHAIGDAALDSIMDIFEEAQSILPRPARHRIEHVSVADDKQIARLKQLGITPVPQGTFIPDLGEGASEAIGEDRASLVYRIGGFLRQDLQFAASTDAPVVSACPIRNIDAMVNRRTHLGREFNSEEKIMVEQAIRAYTLGSAWANHVSDRGVINNGQLADFVLLSEDIYQVPAAHITDIAVTSTFVDGKEVWNARW